MFEDVPLTAARSSSVSPLKSPLVMVRGSVAAAYGDGGSSTNETAARPVAGKSSHASTQRIGTWATGSGRLIHARRSHTSGARRNGEATLRLGRARGPRTRQGGLSRP